MRKSPVYLYVNWTFFILFGAVLMYVLIFFPSSHPVKCIILESTGKPCASCGLSRSLSACMHGEFATAASLNSRGIYVFVFLLSQMSIRAIALFRIYFIHKPLNKNWIVLDIVFSAASTLFCFYPFILSVFTS